MAYFYAMKICLKIVILIIIFILTNSQTVHSEETTVWEISKDDFVKHILNGDENFFQKQNREKIESELEKILNIKLVPTDLETCLKIAAEQNYLIKSRTAEVKENLWYKRYGYAKIIPESSYNYTSRWLQGTYLVGNIVPVSVNEDTIQSYFDFIWNPFDRGRVFFYISQRRSLYKASVAQKEFTKDEIILNTALTYYDLLNKKAELDVYAANLTDRNAQYKMTQARYQVGVGTRFDVYRAEAELAKAKQDYVVAFNTIRTSQAKLANYVGIDVMIPLYPKETGIVPKQLTETKPEQLIEWAKTSRQDLIAEKKRIDAAKAERSSQYTDFIPDIRFEYQNAWFGTKRVGLFPSNTIGIMITAPLGENSGVGTFTKIKAKTAHVQAMEYNWTQMLRNIESDIITSYQASESAKERIEASKQEVYASEKSLENSIVLMNAGLATFIDVIQAQNLKVNSQIGLIQNITEYNKAQVQILFDSGIITQDNVLNGTKSIP